MTVSSNSPIPPSAEQAFELTKLAQEHRFEAAGAQDRRAHERNLIDAQSVIDARKEYARQVLEYALLHHRHLKEYGQACLRSLFILNGGAIVSLLALVGSLLSRSGVAFQPSAFVPAFIYFASGIGLSILSMFTAYLNYGFHQWGQADPGRLANNIYHPSEEWPHDFTPQLGIKISCTFFIAVALGVGSLGAFGCGCFEVAKAFETLDPRPAATPTTTPGNR
ncbi:hypothetical protein [Chelatococcus asaccharovorans]|uniref:hypothetical protein n=1 Tax=Chelatococcus asaccharovorans TaxID=28210 RepID=UPI00224C7239|nr:hypothetical protein [Chelatococcus asaccharovorans]CAH1649606.1 conserved membrane hypothetical protein [Chelatococcus asaccharovorans]CAH1686948.1 conserved membrane hypothetical protein [Chelatococcus asaccharovorans]